MTRLPSTTFSPVADPLDNVADFKPQNTKPDLSQEDIKHVAKASGFTAREAAPVHVAVDGRSLRRTNRKAQLNISVSPATKSAFWTFAKEHGYQIGEEALLALLRKVMR